MSDDFLDDMLGKDRGEVPLEASYRIVVDERFVNPVQAELTERCSIEIQSFAPELPTIFLDDMGELEKPTDDKPEPWAKFFDGRVPAPWECAELAIDIQALVEADPRVIVARRRIEIARDLGPRATKEQYIQACEKEGIKP